MKNKKRNDLAFEKKALTELQKKDTINTDGGDVSGAIRAATERVSEILKHRYTE